MRNFIFGLVLAFMSATSAHAQNITIGNGGSALNATLMQRYAQDPAFSVCATVLITANGHERSDIIISDIKMIRNAVKIAYIADAASDHEGACYFDKSGNSGFILSYAEYLKAMKADSIDMPMSVGALDRMVREYDAIARNLSIYPIDAKSTMLSDVSQ